jgi:hypothetical protein
MEEALMAPQKHPLTGNPHWTFNKPRMGFKTSYTAVERGTGERRVIVLSTTDTCRETLIYNTREALRARLTNSSTRHRGKLKVIKDIDFSDPETARSAVLYTNFYAGHLRAGMVGRVDEFLRICDVVLGPVCVLLDPNRQKGDWWRTNPETALVKVGANTVNYAAWQGSGNWFLAHPALMGIATGLYRQCFQLFYAGLHDEIDGLFQNGEVEGVMTTGNRTLALRMLTKARPYVEVPVGTGGATSNYAVAMGFWRRLIRLQRAVRRHGYEKIFDQTLGESWDLTGGLYEFSGVYSVWGKSGELTDAHRRLITLGAPKRGKNAAKSIAHSS